MKPSVILYKTLPDDLQQRLEEHFTVTQVKNLRPETVSAARRRVRPGGRPAGFQRKS
jgi:hypothetical protein